jgi:hypothetical protein
MTKKEQADLRKLAILEHGFDLPTAMRILSNEWNPFSTCYGYLDTLVRKGLLRHGQGRYHMGNGFRESLLMDTTRAELSQLYFRAAQSLTPYLSKSETTSLGMDSSFQLEYVHEALQLLDSARKTANEGENEKIARLSLQTIHKLLLNVGIPDWSTLIALMRVHESDDHTKHVLDQLIRDIPLNIENDHPVYLATAGEVLLRHSQWLQGNSKRADEAKVKRLRETGMEYFEAAIAKSDRLCDKDSLLFCATRYVVCIKDSRMSDKESVAGELTRKSLSLLSQGISIRGAARRWIDVTMNEIEDDGKVSELYWRAMRELPHPGAMLIPALGAVALAGDDARLAELKKMFKKETISYALISLRRLLLRVTLPPHVQSRIEMGAKTARSWYPEESWAI